MGKSKLVKSALIFFIVLVIIIIGLIGIAYYKLSPKLNDIFEKGDLLLNEQKVNDSLIFLYHLDKKEIIKRSLKNETIFHFIKIRNKEDLDNIKLEVKSFFSRENIDFFLIIDDTSSVVMKKIKQSTFNLPIYFCDKKDYPFKIKDLIYPYTLKVRDCKVVNSSIGGIKNFK